MKIQYNIPQTPDQIDITHTEVLEHFNINDTTHTYYEATKNGLDTWTINDRLTNATLLIIIYYENNILEIDQHHPHPTITWLCEQYHTIYKYQSEAPTHNPNYNKILQSYTQWSMGNGKNNPLYNLAYQELKKELHTNPLPCMTPIYPSPRISNWIK